MQVILCRNLAEFFKSQTFIMLLKPYFCYLQRDVMN